MAAEKSVASPVSSEQYKKEEEMSDRSGGDGATPRGDGELSCRVALPLRHGRRAICLTVPIVLCLLTSVMLAPGTSRAGSESRVDPLYGCSLDILSPFSPQSAKPSPIDTRSGAQGLLDGHSYTSNNTEPTTTTTCPQSGGVILYWNKDYNCDNGAGDAGYFQMTSPGFYNLDSPFDENASSLKVPGGWSVVLFKDADRGGSSACFSSDEDNFEGDTFVNGSFLNDNVSSVEVFDNIYCSMYPVIFYVDQDYTGEYFALWVPDGCVFSVLLDHAASSVRVWPDWSVRVYKELGCSGTSTCFTSNASYFGDYTFDDGSPLNDQMLTFEVFMPPSQPWGPYPADDATGVSQAADLDWADVAAATSYDVYFGTSEDPLLVAQDVTSSDYDLDILQPYTHYHWKIVAYSGCGATATGPIWDFTTGCGTLDWPQSTSPADGATGVSVDADLVWGPVPGVFWYYVYFGESLTPPQIGGTPYPSMMLNTLNPGTHYYWRIGANACDQIQTSPLWDFTTECLALGTPSAPSPVDNVTGVSVEADLDWADAANATSYDVYFGESPTPEKIATTESSSYALPPLSYYTHYYWQIVAKNPCGETTTGPIWDFTTLCLDCLALGTPSTPSPVENATGVSIEADLDWADAANANSYDLYFGTSTSPPYYGTVASSAYDLPILDPETQYYWQVVARNCCGDTVSGPVWDFTTPMSFFVPLVMSDFGG